VKEKPFTRSAVAWKKPMFAQRESGIQAEVPEAASFGMVWRRAETIEWVLFSAFIAALAWVPYRYGSNDLAAWGINAVLFPGLAVIYELFVVVRGEGHPVGLKAIRIPAALFVAVVVWILVQNATWTPSFLHHPIWGMTADALGKPVEGSISVNRDLTTLALVRLITSGSVFWIALQLCRNTTRVNYFLMAIAIIVVGYSTYGIISLALTPGPIHRMGDSFSFGLATSTFLNRNHFATYVGIGLVLTCGLLLRFYGYEVATRGGSLQFRIASIIEATGQQGAILLGAAFLLFVALLFTASRGGIVATGVGLLALATLFFAGRASSGRREIMVFGTILFAVAFFVFGDTILGHITESGIADQNRAAVYVIMLRSILDAPLLGYGYGTFLDLFPMFRDGSVGGSVWEFAHNTYLEVLQGLGVLFGFALIASVALLVVKCCKGAIVRREDLTAPRVAAGVAVLVGVHTLVDFSLQIQAVTLTFMALLGAGVAQAQSSRLVLNG
jgi:O-antigen ligase